MTTRLSTFQGETDRQCGLASFTGSWALTYEGHVVLSSTPIHLCFQPGRAGGNSMATHQHWDQNEEIYDKSGAKVSRSFFSKQNEKKKKNSSNFRRRLHG